MNIDGAWNWDRNVAGFGAIVRDKTGNFVSAKCGREEDVFSPLQAEAVALRAGLSWAVHRGFATYFFRKRFTSDFGDLVRVLSRFVIHGANCGRYQGAPPFNQVGKIHRSISVFEN
ncbi:uncharacterized protein LOC125479239 [Pyrus x bretschneideri]|uniref:uncharacterized protein LOC125479239 n=1 Tax=Pyrus x bretschneideri TaxID=225117 RepID=UPI00202DCECF|nr:uncharacterized protein LOC125479239 [Pyrus x bretschneideri]